MTTKTATINAAEALRSKFRSTFVARHAERIAQVVGSIPSPNGNTAPAALRLRAAFPAIVFVDNNAEKLAACVIAFNANGVT